MNLPLFRIVTFKGVRYALILEVVLNHAYDRSRFLRGARIDESKVPVVEESHISRENLSSLIYMNPSNLRFHLLDKIISFAPESGKHFHATIRSLM